MGKADCIQVVCWNGLLDKCQRGLMKRTQDFDRGARVPSAICVQTQFRGVVRGVQQTLNPALLSIDLEQEARLDDHEERLEELEAAVAARDDKEAAPSDSDP